MALRYLGIDYGSKRVGLAVGDAEAKYARPLITLEGQSTDLAEQLRRICDEQMVGTVVMGLPRGLDGQETAQTAIVRRRFVELSRDLPQLQWYFQDEAVTSELARERLLSRGESVADGAIDREAAAIILQDYLDQL